jgi:hypothetical protein
MAFKAAANLTAPAAASLPRSAEFAYCTLPARSMLERLEEQIYIRHRLIKMIDISAPRLSLFSAQFVNHMAELGARGRFFSSHRFFAWSVKQKI